MMIIYKKLIKPEKGQKQRSIINKFDVFEDKEKTQMIRIPRSVSSSGISCFTVKPMRYIDDTNIRS